jgi:hydrogenase maturation protein HypF
MTQLLAQTAIVDTVALSGGCFQNAILFEEIWRRLDARGFTVLGHSEVPANDGGMALAARRRAAGAQARNEIRR